MKDLHIKSLIIGAVILALGFGGGYYFSQNQIGQERLQGLSIASPNWDALGDEIVCEEEERDCELIFVLDQELLDKEKYMDKAQILIWLGERGIGVVELRDGRLCLTNVSEDGLPDNIVMYGMTYDPREVCDDTGLITYNPTSGEEIDDSIGVEVDGDGDTGGEVLDGSLDHAAGIGEELAGAITGGGDTGTGSATCEECLDYYRTQAGPSPVKNPPPAGCEK